MTQRTMYMFGHGTAPVSTGTDFGGPGGYGNDWDAASSYVDNVCVGLACSAVVLMIQTHFSLAGPDTIDATLMVNGVASSLVAQMTSADGTNPVEALGNVALAPGDLLTLRLVTTNGISSIVDLTGSLELEGQSFHFQTNGGTLSGALPTGSTEYYPLDMKTNGGIVWTTQVLFPDAAIVPVPCQLSSITIDLETAPGAGTGRSFQAYVEGLAVGPQIVIDELNTTGTITIDPPETVNPGEHVQLEAAIDSGVPAATQFVFGCDWITENLGQAWLWTTPNDAIPTSAQTNVMAGRLYGEVNNEFWVANPSASDMIRYGQYFSRAATLNACYTVYNNTVWDGGSAAMGWRILSADRTSQRQGAFSALMSAGDNEANVVGVADPIAAGEQVAISLVTTEPGPGNIPFGTAFYSAWAYTDLGATPDFPPTPPSAFQLIADCPPETEFDEIIDPHGNVFRLSDQRTRFLLSEVGTGLPPIHYVTQAGPFQHGETLIDFFARPRIVTQRYRWPAEHRSDWWRLRTVMADAVRPNRQLGGATRTEALRLRKYLADGTPWDLRVMIDRSPNFAQREGHGWDEWALDEVLRFIAHDPIYFDPNETVVTSDEADDQLTFSDIVPGFVGGADFEPGERIYFGGGREVSVLYAGTWLAWPTIQIEGPVTNPAVSADASGALVSLEGYTVAAGELVTIETEPGKRGVSSPIGGNLIGQVSEASTLTQMFLAPEPLAEGGINTFRLTGADQDDDLTTLRVRYHTRKAGLGL